MHLDRAVYGLAIFVVFLVFAACRGKEQTPVGNQQQTIAVQATEWVRDQWNRGACEALYEQAAVGLRTRPLADWLVHCEHLRKKLGFWESFVSQEAFACGARASVVCLDGKARFGNERYDAIIGWAIENRQPRLRFLILLGQNGMPSETISPPASETIPLPQQPLIDPPPPSGAARRG